MVATPTLTRGHNDTDRAAAAAWSALVDPCPRLDELRENVGTVSALEALCRGDVHIPGKQHSARAVFDRWRFHRSTFLPQRWTGTDPLEFGHEILADAHTLGITMLTPSDPDWPLTDPVAPHPSAVHNSIERTPPQALWVRGNLTFEYARRTGVTLIGDATRTDRARKALRDIVLLLNRRALTIWTDDTPGHGEAIQRLCDHHALGATGMRWPRACITTGGLNRLSPRRIATSGHYLHCSEVPPRAPAKNPHLPNRRDELLAHLSKATIALAASPVSVAPLTHAIRRNRITGALPGPYGDYDCLGSNRALHEPQVSPVCSLKDLDKLLDQI